MTDHTSSTKQYIRGGQIILHYLRMFHQITSKVILILIISTIVLFVIGFVLATHPYERYVLWQWVIAECAQLIHGSGGTQTIIQPDGTQAIVNVHVFLNSELMNIYLSRLQQAALYAVYFSGTVLTLGCVGLIIYLIKRGRAHTADQHMRGDRFAPIHDVKRLIEHQNKASDIRLGIDNLPIIKDSEVQHFLFDGTTGAGKTTAIRELLSWIKRRGDRALIWDEGGDYLSTFFEDEREDALLNALDKRGLPWHLWNECEDIADFESMATALIPMVGAQDPFWVLGARTIFTETAFSIRGDKDKSASRLLTLLLTKSLDDIKAVLKNTYASTLVDDKIEKTAVSIKAVMAAYLKCLRYVKDDANAFSIRDWIRDETASNWLFISSVAKKHEALKPLITTWLDIAINELLSLSKSSNRRLWIILDEMTTLHKLPSLTKALSKGRKFGGCVVVGYQSIALLADIYGDKGAKSISSLLNTRLLFRQPDPDLAAWSAKNFGEEFKEEVKEGLSYGANTMRDGVSINRAETRKVVVSPSEVMTLPNLNCLLRLPGSLPITQLSFEYTPYPELHPSFIPRTLNVNDAVDAEVPSAPSTKELLPSKADKSLQHDLASV